MAEESGSIAIPPSDSPTSAIRYYFENTFFFGMVVGRCKWPRLRFLVILACLILLLIAVCGLDGILSNNRGVIGLANDPLFFSLCIFLPLGFLAILNLLRRLEDLLEAIPDFIIENDAGADRSKTLRSEIDGDKEKIRKFISLKTSRAKFIYRILLSAIAMLFLLTQILSPFILHFTALSWALAPYAHPRAYVLACIWTLFWNMAVGEICWFVFSITIASFSLIRRYAKEKSIVISPVYTKQVEALSKVGDLALANSLFFSCGLIVIIIWVWKFLPTTLGYPYFIAYALGMVAVGIVPVWNMRNAIQKAKTEQLKKLGTLFNDYLKLLIADPKPAQERAEASTTISPDDVSRIALLEIAYARVEKMPVWPFAGSVRAIFSANMLATFVSPLAKTYSNLLPVLFYQ
jgi:hypothetical protein